MSDKHAIDDLLQDLRDYAKDIPGLRQVSVVMDILSKETRRDQFYIDAIRHASDNLRWLGEPNPNILALADLLESALLA